MIGATKSGRTRWIGGLAAAAALGGSILYAVAGAGTSEATLVTSTGRHSITVEIADTPEARATGLMNRPSMPKDHGMLFSFEQTEPVSFWMKNTLIPLDMIFIGETGVVERIATNVPPLSLKTVPSGKPVRYVLELNGGASAGYGLKDGDRVEHALIGAKP
ncbi:DUF192 domain-containing protein [Mangrovicella endophytica]|uniref:DUF192 domain-containing protein n=1 Tax=Mangrovicella endophytica TaxID=2066697 RepID=UPI001FDF1468|nr:DUF192 domain-containing protein [Mangrovicella endophytica]